MNNSDHHSTDVILEPEYTGLEIAVIGMAGRFPGADDIPSFWENLKNGIETISFLDDEQLEKSGVDAQLYNQPNYVRAKGILTDIESFDAGFFGYSPREAEVMDPQMRIFYECVWHALEDAGYDPWSYKGLIGIYAGSRSSFSWEVNSHFSGVNHAIGEFAASILNDKDYLCSRIAYKFNLKGPAYTIQSACSTSLVAIHLAGQMLLSAECDMAIAGGIAVAPTQRFGHRYQEGMIFSPDGHCRTFDARGEGTVFGEGAGVVILKRLEEAEKDDDHIYAVIKGSATNNDGASRIGFTAPGIDGQTAVIRAALKMAEVDPETVGYIEAHGTATRLGDPIELEALTRAFNTTKSAFCRIGSVKSNVGHLNTAAGVTGFIKTVLALKYKQIPPSLHFESPNPEIDFEKSPFIVNTGLYEWTSAPYPRRAGVSSFGIGGTNAHVVLEEWLGESRVIQNKIHAYDNLPDSQLILLSARSETALEQTTGNIAHFLKAHLHDHSTYLDAVYTLQIGRKHFNYRRMLVAQGLVDAVAKVSNLQSEQFKTFICSEKVPSVIFMFPGQGAQYLRMGQGLYCQLPLFKEYVDRCFDILTPVLGEDIKSMLYPGDILSDDSQIPGEPGKIDQTAFTQPLLFAVEYAMAKVVLSWGIRPVAMIGHSIGEYVAACLAGAISLEDALNIVAVRGRLMQQMAPGDMLSVAASETELLLLMKDRQDLSLAAVNGPVHCVISGTKQAVSDMEQLLTARNIPCRMLHTSHAYHSAMMEPILEQFHHQLEQILSHSDTKSQRLKIPFVSNLTGKWMTLDESRDARYWTRHLRHAVRFNDGLTTLSGSIEDSINKIFIEIGPGRALSTFVEKWASSEKDSPVNLSSVAIQTMRHPRQQDNDITFLMDKIGQLWLYGQTIDWKAYYRNCRPQRISLPGYPFEKQTFPIHRILMDLKVNLAHSSPVLLPKQAKPGVDGYFYVPRWEQVELSPRQTSWSSPDNSGGSSKWLVWVDSSGLGTALVEALEKAQQSVVIVKAGKGFSEENGANLQFTLHPSQPQEYELLFKEIHEQGIKLHHIVYLWGITGITHDDRSEESQDAGYLELMYLVQSLGNLPTAEKIRLTVISDGMQGITGDEYLVPNKSLISGFLHVIPQEYNNITCHHIDVSLPGDRNPEYRQLQIQRVASRLLQEFQSPVIPPVMAYRGLHRWVLKIEPLDLEKVNAPFTRLKEEGVYLITGGIGGIGLELAKFLVFSVKAKMALISRSFFPPREDWTKWLENPDGDSDIRSKIERLLELEEAGGQVRVYRSDVTRLHEMKEVFADVQQQWGEINGVIHAAGVADGRIIQLHTAESVERILAPKVKGTWVLDNILQSPEINSTLDFFILCSSTRALSASAGQAAYAAANTFLNAYAYYKSVTSGKYVVSINWDAWLETGMAADYREKQEGMAHRLDSQDLNLSISDQSFKALCFRLITENKPGQTIYSGQLRLQEQWFLAEHRVNGLGIVPATAYLEMVVSVFRQFADANEKSLRLHEVHFLQPLALNEHSEKEIRIIFESQETHYTFIVGSMPESASASGEQWQQHCVGSIDLIPSQLPKQNDIAQLSRICSDREVPLNRLQIHAYREKGLWYGPRWDNRKQVLFGQNQGLALLKLEARYTRDLEEYRLHPALLDMATAFPLLNIDHEDPYFPFSYKSIIVKGSLPATLYSFCRFKGNENNDNAFTNDKETISFDITLMDEQGVTLVEIEAFTLIRLSPERIARLYGTPKPGHEEGDISRKDSKTHPDRVGLLTAEAIDAFSRILEGSPFIPQVVVSPRDFSTSTAMWSSGQSQPTASQTGSSPSPSSIPQVESGGKYRRPQLTTAYVAARTPLEESLAETWKQFFGFDEVGVYDDFFQLGGDSLKVTTMISYLHRQLNIEIPLGEFFNRPTIVGLSEYIEAAELSRFYAIQPVEQRDYYPVSSAQKRLYVVQQLSHNSTAYNTPLAVELLGALEEDRLKDSFMKMIQRHESLRTSINIHPGSIEDPVQEIHLDISFEIERFDVIENVSSVETIMQQFIRPFDLAQAPLMRAGLIEQNQDKHILLLDIHHIIADFIAIRIFLKELLMIYEGDSLPPLKIQYKDYAHWQNRLLHSPRLSQQEKYWLQEFSFDIPVLNLPLDFPRPAVQSFEGDIIEFYIEREETFALKELALAENATLYIVLLTAYSILLGRLSNQDEIVVGTPSAGRGHVDLEGVIGMFVNTLALPTYPSFEKTLRDFLKETRDKTLKAFENQDYPFENLVEKTVISRDVSRNALFDVVFALQNINLHPRQEQDAKAHSQRLVIRPLEFENKISKFDLNLTASEEKDRLFFTFQYCTHLFKSETIHRFVQYFKTILSTLLLDLNRTIADIELVSCQEIEFLLYTLNSGNATYPREKTINRIIEEQVARTPDYIALIGDEHAIEESVSLSYQELNNRANETAAYLVEKGVGSENIVAIKMTRSLDIIIAIIATLKVGAAYMPIDPDYPRDRIEYMLKDSNASFLLEHLNHGGHKGHGGLSNQVNRANQGAGNIAYIIYTSGTTGMPKGTVVQHNNVVQLLCCDRFQFDFNARDTWAVFHSFCFDFSVWEMYGALFYGGKVVIVPSMKAKDPAEYFPLLLKHQVSILNQTPSSFYNLIHWELTQPIPSLKLRYVIFGGEALSPGKLIRWYERYPNTKLINMYGITETTVHVTYKEIHEPEIIAGISNIGKPIPTLTVYSMGNGFKLQPLGVPGELCVGGFGVARGYLNRPKLTHEKFVPNPYKPGEILYRSGDLVRIHANGEMEYLGRCDQQVKIRGYRIEPGEIESRLIRHPAIDEAVVVCREDDHGDRYLCAYITGKEIENDIASNLRDYLSEGLPDYMIPAFFITLERIPLTPNGKVNRNALPEPQMMPRDQFVAPRDETEEKLVRIWTETLPQRTGIGIDDNFFNIGGDSIKAIRLLSAVNQQFQSQLKVVDLYTHSTIRHLARLTKEETRSKVHEQETLSRIGLHLDEFKIQSLHQLDLSQAGLIRDIYPMTDIEKGLAFYYLKNSTDGTGIYHDQFVYLLHYPQFDLQRFEKTLELLTAKHEILRTGFNIDDFAEPVHVEYQPGAITLDLQFTDLSALDRTGQRDRIAQILAEDRQQPFIMSKAPLWRMHVVSLAPGNDEIALLFVVHHAIMDGWSVASLIIEMRNTYFALQHDPDLALHPLAANYKDTVIHELKEKQNPDTLKYWKNQLSGYQRLEFSETLKNKNQLSPMVVYFQGAGAQLLENLNRGAKKHHTSLKNLCFGAYAFIMSMFSIEKDVVVGCVTNNRPPVTDGDKILGCFLNTVPVRLKIPSPLTWEQYIRMVEDHMLELKAFERLSLFEIALTIGEKSKERNPVFDTLFNFMNFHVLHQTGPDDEPLRLKAGKETENTAAPFSVHGQQDTNTLFDFEVNITHDDLLLCPKYNTDAIKPETVAAICRYFLNILHHYLQNPQGPALLSQMMPETEKELLLETFNNTDTSFDSHMLMHRLFENQVERTLYRIALKGLSTVLNPSEMMSLSYNSLNCESNNFSALLRSKGLKPGGLVAVMMKRTVEMAVTVMGILKAGGAYVPLEPDLPHHRVRKILASLGVRFIVTSPSVRPEVMELSSQLPQLQHIFCYDHLLHENLRTFDSIELSPVEPAITPDHIAYIIYTSGSTGTPKGVVETHRPVINVIQWVNRTCHVGDGNNRINGNTLQDKLIFVASLGFDLSVYDIFGILAAGGMFRIVESLEFKDPLYLLNIIVKEGITIWDSAPAALQQLVPFFSEQHRNPQVTCLRLVMLSGDWIPVTMPDALRETFAGVSVLSLGGATEATIWSNYYPIGTVEPQWPSIPYGKPIQNARYYILDRDLSPCPLRVPGNLYIGGQCLALGYIDDPQLSAQKFIPNPFRPDEKMYMTGDMARWFEDGNMQFLGRKDHQVKIRGYRIELGEIETQLLRHPQVKECIVLDRLDHGNNKYLCAYIVPSPAEDTGNNRTVADKESLKEHLLQELPGYMVPAYFIVVDSIPVTANGKVDRSALPVPGTSGESVKTAVAPPENPIQQKLLDIWLDILGMTPGQIGIDSDFFESGGHSLNATLMVSRIHKKLQVKIPLAEIFHKSTIRSLSLVILNAAKVRYHAIPPVEKQEYYPLSSSQKRLYILQQLERESTAYNESQAVVLEGELQIDRLEHALKQLLERHHSLRTSIIDVNRQPMQRIHPMEEIALPFTVMRDVTDNDIATLLRQLVQPFDLAQAPFLRIAVLQTRVRQYLLFIDIHHIVTDGISYELFVKELLALYAGNSLLPLPLQYHDYSHWQNRQLKQGVLGEQEKYWLSRFSDDLPLMDLPYDFPRPEMQSFAGDIETFIIKDTDYASIKEFALEHEVTPFILFLAIFQIFLSRLSNQEDILVGTPVAGRRHPDLESIIGVFVNTLVMRNYPRGEKVFLDFLEEVKQSSLEALENQDYPFEDLVEKVIIKRDTGRNPLFDTAFVFQDITRKQQELAGSITSDLEIKQFPRAHHTSKFDLTLNCSDNGKEFYLFFEFCTSLFKKNTLFRFIQYFKRILEAVILQPSRYIKQIEIFSPEERDKLIHDFNRGDALFPRNKTLQMLFEEQVLRTPDSIALKGERIQNIGDSSLIDSLLPRPNDDFVALTYRELNVRAEQLAAYLREEGTGPEDIVALMMPRSIEMIIAVMGIMKAGAAYMPIDPDYPQDRLDYMMKDSQASVLLSKERWGNGKWEVGSEHGTLPGTLQRNSMNPANQGSDNNIAYIIYTSGSTGRPKGVMVEHRQVVQLLFFQDQNIRFDFNRQDTWTLFHSISFDFSVWEMFGALLYGGKLIVVPKPLAQSPADFVALLAQQQVTVLNQIPTVFHNISVQALRREDNPGKYLRYIIFGGEALNPVSLASWHEKYPDTSFINMYGITETTVHVTFKAIGPKEILEGKSNIGRALPTLQVYIVDPYLRLQPIGLSGEILVAGHGLARGYLNRPELTKEKFIPYSSCANLPVPISRSQLYASGDLGMFSETGDILYMGRKDSQVKIRGFRIELDEIQTRLLKYQGIKEVVITIDGEKSPGHGTENHYILAYFTASMSLTPAQLREYLAGKLPEYMIPAYFLQLEKFPVTPSGKIDKKQLKTMEFHLKPDTPYTAPETEIQRTVTEIWQEALNLEKIGLYDSFFEIGGNSLKSIQVIEKINRQFQVQLPMAAIFKYPTIDELARFLEQDEHLQRDRSSAVQRGKDIKKQKLEKRRGRNR